MRPKTLILTAAVALFVVVAHDKVKTGAVAMPKTVR